MTFRCLLCNSKDGQRIFFKPDISIFLGVYSRPSSKPEKFPASLWQCSHCGFVQQEISDKLISFLNKVYSEDSFISTPPGTSSWGNSRAQVLSEYMEQYLGWPCSILEIGCQSGYLLSQLQRKYSCRSVGIEPGNVPPGPDNITFINDFFPSEKLGDEKFDVIIAQAVLEHVFTPLDILKSIKKHLNPSGIVIVQVPDCTGHFETGDLGLFGHEHISYFTTATLEFAIRLAGFSPINITNRIPGGHLLGIFTHGENNCQVPEFDTGPSQYSRCFDMKIEYLMQFFTKGMPVGLYGTCIGAHNFIQIKPEISDKVILYDSDEFKHGKYLADVSRSIHNYSDLTNDPVSTVLIMPYTYQNEIFSFLKSNTISGKEFIKIY